MSETCQQCQDYESKQQTGNWKSAQAFNRWAMFGCTCTEKQMKEAMEWFNSVTR